MGTETNQPVTANTPAPRKPGWQVDRGPVCLHLGAAFTSVLGMANRREGDEWVCQCGEVFVVRMTTREGMPVKVLRERSS